MYRKSKLALLGLALTLSLAGCGASSSGSSYSSTMGSVSESYSVNSDSALSLGSNSKHSETTNLANWESSYNHNEEVSYEEAVVDEAEAPNTEIDTDAEMTLAEEKLVYHCDIQIETKEYDASYSYLKGLIEEYGGLIQCEYQKDSDYDWYYSENYNTSGTLRTDISCRIPSKHYNEFVNTISTLDENSKVVSKNTRIENISQEYYDNTTRIESLKIQEDRLLDMLANTHEISDMIEIEDRLTEVEYELRSLNTKLIYMDMDVAYSYVDITLEEVKEYTTVREETTFFTRLWDNIKDAWNLGGELFEGLLNTILHLIPILIFVVAPVVIFFILAVKFVIFLIKKADKKSNFGKKFKDFFVGNGNINNTNGNINNTFDKTDKTDK